MRLASARRRARVPLHRPLPHLPVLLKTPKTTRILTASTSPSSPSRTTPLPPTISCRTRFHRTFTLHSSTCTSPSTVSYAGTRSWVVHPRSRTDPSPTCGTAHSTTSVVSHSRTPKEFGSPNASLLPTTYSRPSTNKHSTWVGMTSPPATLPSCTPTSPPTPLTSSGPPQANDGCSGTTHTPL